MKLNRKEKIFTAVLICSLIVPSLTIFGQEDRILEPQKDFSTVESPLSNVTIEMITNLPSHRTDGIPSTLPESTFTVQFNITNFSSEEVSQLELSSQTNEYGVILNPLNETKDNLNLNESWISQEYIIETGTLNTGVSKSLDLAIVLDQSGSMDDEIQVLTSELIDVIDEISTEVPDFRLSLILFGGTSSNPYTNPNLVYPLTDDIESIVTVLGNTAASGGHEPWGDALWVAQNNLDWREDTVKLIILITDEPCDGGVVIGSGSDSDYDGPLLYNLFENLAQEGFVLCSIAASGSDSLTKVQLEAGAEYTEGTYIVLGEGELQTGDIPEIIGELIVYYAVELNFQIKVTLSHLNEFYIRKSMEKTFVILIDDLPPEIDSWVYISEDFITDEKLINVMCEVKDVTGTAFVDIYYKIDDIPFWTIANASQVFNHSYVLTLPYVFTSEILRYQVYSEDWLENEIMTEVFEINLEELENQQLVSLGKRREFILLPNQAIVCKLIGHAYFDSFGLIFSRYSDNFDVLAADVNDSEIILNNKNVPYQTVVVEKDHLIKVSLISQNNARVIVANVIPQNLSFEQEISREIDETDALLFRIDNKFSDEDDRSIVADSIVVQTSIIVFNASNWEFISKGASEVILPEEDLYILVYAEYHTGEIFISFDYEDQYTPYGHYWTGATEPMATNYWPIYLPLLCLAVIAIIIKKRR